MIKEGAMVIDVGKCVCMCVLFVILLSLPTGLSILGC